MMSVFHFLPQVLPRDGGVVLLWPRHKANLAMPYEKILLFVIPLSLIFVEGCWQSKYIFYHDIIHKPSREWNRTECREVIESNIQQNRFDNEAPVRILATPFNPLVITAVNRLSQEKNSLTESQFTESLREDLVRYAGLSFDTVRGCVIDKRGRAYVNELQLDSILFLVSVYNININGDISNLALSGSVFDLKNFPLYDQNVEYFRDRLYLENARKELLKPNWFAAKEGGRLVDGQSFIAMFQLDQETFHFLEGSGTMTLIVKGFGADIRLPFDLNQGGD